MHKLLSAPHLIINDDRYRIKTLIIETSLVDISTKNSLLQRVWCAAQMSNWSQSGHRDI